MRRVTNFQRSSAERADIFEVLLPTEPILARILGVFGTCQAVTLNSFTLQIFGRDWICGRRLLIAIDPHSISRELWILVWKTVLSVTSGLFDWLK